ncbi:MAG TPA: ATP phosphoribosyltransferase regulatory subunit [Burkholderiales bacterium]|jgi:ATP phosphoribosyltransferase regulatory subunit|nr:ATP phosphoribosyltransferase regulatory subunit [Burkholderiales bacterium]
MQKWLLPEYIDDVLPAEARRVEALRRRLLDLFAVHGYELVMPPLIEYLDSLLTGTGHDLDLRTFKLVDQLSGRLLGLRADITPQVARIDAHLLNRRGVTRLCYAGSVLHALPSGLLHSREPLQIGAELYGHAGVESDIEIQTLMLRALAAAGVSGVHLDLGHVAVFRTIVRRGAVPADREAELFQVLQAKDRPALRELTAGLDQRTREALSLLPELYGGAEVLAQARKRLTDYPDVAPCLDLLEQIASRVSGEAGELCFDLAELRGYHYHSGVVFAAYARGRTEAIARGGRYDEVGRAFGRARPATGFSIDLRDLAALSRVDGAASRVLAPYAPQDAALQAEILRLRQSGTTVVIDLPGHAEAREELECDAELAQKEGRWTVVRCGG